MQRNELTGVVETMNDFERARATEVMAQAMRLANATLAVTSKVRDALGSAGQAMTVVYGRTGS